MSLLLLVALARPASAQALSDDALAVRRHGDQTVKRVGWVVTGVGGGMIVSGLIYGAASETEHQATLAGAALLGGGALIGGIGLIVTGLGHALPNPRYDRTAHVGVDVTADGAMVRFTTRW